VRKRDKALTASAASNNPADAMPIDMEMVRASSQRGGVAGSGEQAGSLDTSQPSTPTAGTAPALSASSHSTAQSHGSRNGQEQQPQQSPPTHHHDPYKVAASPYAHTHPQFAGIAASSASHQKSIVDISPIPVPTPPWETENNKGRYGAIQEYMRTNTSDERSGSP
jgi:hypothetical protein